MQSRGQLQHLGLVGPFRELVVLRDELCFFGEPLGLRVSDARTGAAMNLLTCSENRDPGKHVNHACCEANSDDHMYTCIFSPARVLSCGEAGRGG